MDIRLIANDDDCQEALAEIDRLWGSEPGSPEHARTELLAMLVHHYERAREPLPPLDPIEAIKFRMEQRGITRKDMLPIFGTTARVSEVLNGKRALTLAMIRKLHGRFGVALESLIAPPAPQARKASQRGPKRPQRERSHRGSRDSTAPRP